MTMHMVSVNVYVIVTGLGAHVCVPGHTGFDAGSRHVRVDRPKGYPGIGLLMNTPSV